MLRGGGVACGGVGQRWGRVAGTPLLRITVPVEKKIIKFRKVMILEFTLFLFLRTTCSHSTSKAFWPNDCDLGL